MKVLIIDNYDSFTYNIVHYIKDIIDTTPVVIKNDEINLEEVNQFDKILLSPGPGIPDEAGYLKALIKQYANSKSIFGICLGMQAIGESFGAELIKPDRVFHGLSMPVDIIDHNDITFKDLPPHIMVGRYHSWVLNHLTMPDCLCISSVDKYNRVMSVYHKTMDIRGVQFHPESILTEHGKTMLKNWLH